MNLIMKSIKADEPDHYGRIFPAEALRKLADKINALKYTHTSAEYSTEDERLIITMELIPDETYTVIRGNGTEEPCTGEQIIAAIEKREPIGIEFSDPSVLAEFIAPNEGT